MSGVSLCFDKSLILDLWSSSSIDYFLDVFLYIIYLSFYNSRGCLFKSFSFFINDCLLMLTFYAYFNVKEAFAAAPVATTFAPTTECLFLYWKKLKKNKILCLWSSKIKGKQGWCHFLLVIPRTRVTELKVKNIFNIQLLFLEPFLILLAFPSISLLLWSLIGYLAVLYIFNKILHII